MSFREHVHFGFGYKNFKPGSKLVSAFPLTPSLHLDPLPELGDPGTTLVVTPASYSDLNSMLAANPTVDTFLFSPGDYTGWYSGTIVSVTATGGSASRRRVLRYYNPGQPDNPVQRPASQADFFPIQFTGDSAYWIVHGLTFNMTGLTVGQSIINMRPGSEHIVVDHCLFEDHYQGAVICYASYCIVQRCVIRNARITEGVDTYGLMFTPQQGNAVHGCKALDCEIYNMVDGIAGTVGSAPGDAFTEVQVMHEGHDVYNEPEYIASGPMENHVDIKVGSDSGRSYLRDCRIWGLATSDGGSGGSNHGVLFHRGARNWTIEGCIIGENTSEYSAYYESVWQAGDNNPEGVFGPRNMVFKDNLVYDTHAAFGSTLDGQMLDNIVVRCSHLFYRGSASGRLCPVDPITTGNRLGKVSRIFDPEEVEAPPYYEDMNEELGTVKFRYERKRWTGPEWARVNV